MARWPIIAILVTTAFVFTGCASNVEEFSEVVKADHPPTEIKSVLAVQSTGVITYQYEGKPQSAEWIICTNESANTTALLLAGATAFSAEGFCQSWIPQLFLGKKIAVLAVNRPGFGKSSGTKELSGPASAVAMESVVKGTQKNLAGGQISGAWGLGEGGIGAAFFAKKNPQLQWLILGNGFYDLEATFQGLPEGELKQLITELRAKEHEAVFEARSIAWDFSGLPKKIYLYHGQNNAISIPAQVTAFRDTLVTREYIAVLNLIEGATDQLTDDQHQHVLSQILEQVAPEQTAKEK